MDYSCLVSITIASTTILAIVVRTITVSILKLTGQFND